MGREVLEGATGEMMPVQQESMVVHDASTGNQVDDGARVYIVDDDAAVRDSMCELVRGMDLTCECFASAQEFLDAHGHGRCQEGCVVVDLRMPGMTGIELQRRLRDAGEWLPLIFVTGFADVPTSVLAMKSGAVDFLEKPYQPAELRASIRRAMSEDRQRRRHAQRRADLTARFASLDDEERAVLELLCQGEPMKSIANRLSISLRTAHSRRASILTKTEARSREELLGMFVELNQLEGRFD